MSVEPITKPKSAKPANDTAPHVIRAINAVSAEIAKEGLSKSRSNQQQGYKFRGIDEVLNLLATIIAEHKLVIIPHVQTRDITERQTKSGGALFSVVVRVDYTFISAEDGSRETVGPFDGEAMDSADKATNKAMSAAYKYMAIQTFCIPTEGDNDADATTHDVVPRAAGGESPANPPAPRQQRISKTELAALQERIDATGTDIVLFCKYLGVGALAELMSPTGYQNAVAALDAKAKAKPRQEAVDDTAK